MRGLPPDAVIASLGCGNPTALAELKPGETVLDLGSGGGIDILLSVRRVGPTGKAYGLDMTDQMLALSRENQRRAGFENVVQRGEAPSDVPEFARSTVAEHLVAGEPDTYDLSRLLVAVELASSRTEARRLLQQSAVEIDGQKPSAERARVPAGALIRAGRRRFARIAEG